MKAFVKILIRKRNAFLQLFLYRVFGTLQITVALTVVCPDTTLMDSKCNTEQSYGKMTDCIKDILWLYLHTFEVFSNFRCLVLSCSTTGSNQAVLIVLKRNWLKHYNVPQRFDQDCVKISFFDSYVFNNAFVDIAKTNLFCEKWKIFQKYHSDLRICLS